MSWWDNICLEEFLSRNPKMRLSRMNNNEIVIEGDYDISAQMDGANPIEETFKLKLIIDKNYPRQAPKVFETGGEIPRTPDYHINHDGSFCLGSEIKVKSVLFDSLKIVSFSQNLLTPFLYSIRHKIKFNSLPYGELDHGEKGLIDDYQQLFGVKDKLSVLLALGALGRRKRDANKLPCPCCCGERLGKCSYRFSLNKWRKLEKRRWYRSHLANDFTPIEKQRKRKKHQSQRKNVQVKADFFDK